MKRKLSLLISCLWAALVAMGQQAPGALPAPPAFHCASETMMQARPPLIAKQQAWEEELLHNAPQNQQAKNGTLPYVLPVVVHIVHQNGAENISDAQVLAAVEHLNQAFAHEGYYADLGDGANTQIQFCLAKRTPDGQATNGITRTESPLTNMVTETDDLPLKDLSRWDPLDYVNIWVVASISSLSSGPGVAGYAYLASAHGELFDGLVCEAQFFGADAAQDAVFIHEIGHYLNLYHTFQEGCPNADCQANGDHVCDTPPDQATHTACDNNSCGTDADDTSANNPFDTDVADATENFMDYSPFPCYRNFTDGQGERMRLAIEQLRPSLLASQGCLDPCTSPIIAAFSTSATEIFAGQTVVFTNQTTGATNYEWWVNGVLQATTTDFSYLFPALGSFQIMLKAFGTDPNCEGKAVQNIAVGCNLVASFSPSTTVLGVGETLVCTNTSTGPVGYYQWFINGVALTGATDLNYTFANAGYYTVVLQAIGSYCYNEFSAQVTVQSDSPCQDSSFTALHFSFDNSIGNFSYLLPPVYHPDGGLYAYTYISQPSKGFLARFDAAGNSLWQKQVDSPLNGIEDICVLIDGSPIFATDYHHQLCKINQADGSLAWAMEFPELDFLPEFRTINLGDGALAYTTSATDTSTRLFLIKVVPDGSIAWNKVYDIADNLNIVFQNLDESTGNDSNGGFSMVGIVPDSTLSGLTGAVLKFDHEGQFLFCKKYDQPDNTGVAFYNLAFNPAGEMLVGGTIGTGNANNPDNLSVKLGPNGEVIWAKKHAGLMAGSLAEVQKVVAKPGGGFLQMTKKTLNSSDWISWTEGGQAEFVEKITSPGFLNAVVKVGGKMKGMIKPSHYAPDYYLYDLDESGKPLGCATYTTPNLPTTDVTMTVEDIGFSLANTFLTPVSSTFTTSTYANTFQQVGHCGAALPCPELCDNGLDDNANGYVDCFDPDCTCDIGAGCYIPVDIEPGIPSVKAKIAWQTPDLVPSVLATPIVANLDQSADQIAEIIMSAGIISPAETANLLLIYQGDGSNAGHPDTLVVPGSMVYDRPPAPAVGDIDHNGVPELVQVCLDGRIRVFTGFTHGAHPCMSLWATSMQTAYNNMAQPALADFDSDGIAEIYLANEVFKFSFSANGTPSLTKVVDGGAGHAATLGGATGGFQMSPTSTAADILSVADCGGDPDCKGLELVAGANIYSIDLNPFDGDAAQIKVQRDLNLMLPGNDFADGLTVTADLNLDGRLDVVVAALKGSEQGIYVWDKNGLVKFMRFPSSAQVFLGIPTVANVYNDLDAGYAVDYPEIVATGQATMSAFNLHKAEADPNNPWWWNITNIDNSAHTGSACFDFNGDGLQEIVHRGENFMRIIYGGAVPFPPGVSSNRSWYNLPCRSHTYQESIVVADVDGNGEANIVFGAYPSDYSYFVNTRSKLWVMESDAGNWLPCRSIWNQYNYNGIHVNDDLSIPKEQQAHHLEFPGLGSGQRPFNSARCQWPIWGPNYEPANPVPDADVSVDSIGCEGDSIRLWLRICNTGATALPGGLPISIYQNDPRQAGALWKGTVPLPSAVPVGDCAFFSVEIGAVLNAPVFAVANDDGSQPLPYAMADFPIANQVECGFDNNFGSASFSYQTGTLDLGPDRSICNSSISVLHAGAGFRNYHWQDGSTDSTFTAFGIGKYWVDAWDACGLLHTDTLNILLDQAAAIDLGPDQTICSGEAVELGVPGFANVQWYPVPGLSCHDCPTTTAAPNGTTTYYVTAANGSCFASDSVRIVVLEAPSLVLNHVDGDCNNIASITATASGGTSLGYLWSNGETGATIFPTQAGSYTVTVSIPGGCDVVGSASLSINTDLFLDLETTPITCSGSPGQLTALASGGVGPYTYAWSNGGVGPSVPAVASGTVEVTVTDANGCIAGASTVVGVVGQLQLGITVSPITCHGSADGSATVSPIGGTLPFTWAWQGGQTASTIANLETGLYAVTVTDAVGCSDELSFLLTAPPALSLGISGNDISCFGEMDGTATVTATGGTPGYGYFWSNAQLTATAEGLAPGWHTVTVTDDNGCTDTTGLLLTEPPALVLSISGNDISCFGEMDGTATVAATGGTPGYGYFWNNAQLTATAEGLAPGWHTVTVTDDNGCTDTTGLLLAEPPALLVGVLADDLLLCPDQTTSVAALAAGGTPPYAYLWNTGPMDSLLTGATAGTYSVTLTDAHGCTAASSASITAQPGFVLELDSIAPASLPTASDGGVYVAIVGGGPPFAFLWSNGDSTQNLVGVLPGDYTLTVTDGGGCTQVFSFHVDFLNTTTQRGRMDWSAQVSPNPAWDGASARLSIRSARPQTLACRILDVTGKSLHFEQIELPSGTWAGSIPIPYAAGVYTLVLSNDRELVCLKWVVLHNKGD